MVVTYEPDIVARMRAIVADDEAEQRRQDRVLSERLGELEADTVMSTYREHDRLAYEHALRLVSRPDVLNIVSSDYETLGYVGEIANKQLMYLAATSRLMDDPLSVIVKSSSAAGKSRLVRITADLMPPGQVEDLSRVSKQALFNMDRGAIKHKMVVVMEKAGADDADYAVRTLITEKILTSRVTLSTPYGRRAELRVVEGPVAYVTTTTDRIDEQLMNRVLLLRVDETDAQTARIHEAQRAARTAQGLGRVGQIGYTIKAHHIVQQALKPIRVVIPYANHLRFPIRSVSHRRQNEVFLNVISATALLRQYQKPILTAGVPGGQIRYIEADLTDYGIAYRLAPAAFDLDSSPDLTQTQRRLLADVRRHVRVAAGEGQPEEVVFTRADLEEKRWTAKQLKDHVPDLVDAGYLAVFTGGGHGRRQAYTLVGPLDEADDGLLSPDDLRALVEAGD